MPAAVQRGAAGPARLGSLVAASLPARECVPCTSCRGLLLRTAPLPFGRLVPSSMVTTGTRTSLAFRLFLRGDVWRVPRARARLEQPLRDHRQPHCSARCQRTAWPRWFPSQPARPAGPRWQCLWLPRSERVPSAVPRPWGIEFVVEQRDEIDRLASASRPGTTSCAPLPRRGAHRARWCPINRVRGVSRARS